MNVGSVTPEFKRGIDVHFLVDQQFGYVRLAAPLLDLAGIITEFCGAISTQFCFSYSLGLHCYAARSTRLFSVTHF